MDKNSIEIPKNKISFGGYLLIISFIIIIGFFIYPKISLQKDGNLVDEKGGDISKIVAPSKILDLSGEAADSKVYLDWSEPENGGSPITGYIVKYFIDKKEIVQNTDSTEYVVSDLENDLAYAFSVAAVNEAGVSEYSDIIELVPKKSEAGDLSVPGIVLNFAGEPQIDSSLGYINLTWDAPESDGGSPLSGYTIGYLKSESKDDPVFEKIGVQDYYKIEGLDVGHEYTVSIISTNDIGNSEPVSIKVMVSFDKEEDDIFELSSDPSVNVSHNSATITWGTNKSASSQVVYGATEGLGRVTQKINTTPMVKGHVVNLENLLSCTSYFYKVVSYNSDEKVIESAKGDFLTLGCKGDAEVVLIEKGLANQNSGLSLEAKQSGRGISLDVPANVKSGKEVAIQALIVSKEDVMSEISKPEGKKWIGKSYVLSAIEDSVTEVTNFDKPVTVSIDYLNDEIGGIDPNTLRIWHYEDDIGWRQLNSCSTFIDGDGGTVTCQTASFSIFGLFGEDEGGSNDGSQNSGDGSDGLSESQNQSNSIQGSSSGSGSYSTVNLNNSTTGDSQNQVDSMENYPFKKYNFLKNLWMGIRDRDVLLLQKLLNENGYVVNVDGPGSPGNETDFFGPKTKEALIKFQEAYRLNILTPIGLNFGTGFFGPMTRNFINSMEN